MKNKRFGFNALASTLIPSIILLVFHTVHAEGPTPIIHSSELIITVNNNGKKAPQVTVCVGTKENRSLYGLKKTNSDGQVFFSGLPKEPVVITAQGKTGGVEVERIHPWLKIIEISVSARLENQLRCSLGDNSNDG